MPPSEPTLIDTNVLVYALDGSSPHHAASRTVLDRAQSADAGLCASPQCIAEFFSLVTNPRRVASPIPVADALVAVETLLALPGLEVLPVPLDVVARWIELCRQHPVTGAEIYDLQLVAVMLGNNVKRICTYNGSDFAPFSEITVEVP